MFKIIAVTNRALCAGDFPKRLDAIAASGVSAVILREKDLSPADYAALFARARAICERRGVPLIAHGFANASRSAGAGGLHLPVAELAAFDAARRDGETDRDIREDAGGLLRGARTGISVHSIDETRRAVLLGASYIVAGHIFRTESKAARAPRGLAFLSEICALSPVPVYAIGGISEQNIASVKEEGAAGVCLMSSFMTCPDPTAHTRVLRHGLAAGANHADEDEIFLSEQTRVQSNAGS